MKIQTALSIILITGFAGFDVGCGGEEGGANTATGTQTTQSSSSGVGGTGGAGGQGGNVQTGGSGGGGGGSGGAGGGGGVGGSGGSSAGELVPNLKSMDLYINCMPIVPADPVIGSFTVDYDTTAAAGPTSATIISSKLIFGAQVASFTFSVMPNSTGSIAPGAVVGLMHQKVNGSGSGDKAPCSLCNENWALEVKFDVNGKTVTDTLPPTKVSCVF